MRLHRLVVVGVIGAVSVVVIACGLEQGGLLVELDAGIDATKPDQFVPDSPPPPVDVFVPDVVAPSCTTLDASGCLPPFNADAGWKPIVIPTTASGCPAPPPDDASWTAITYYSDASLAPGSCACGCSVSAPGCAPDGSVTYGNVTGCTGDAGVVLNLPTGVCVDNTTPAAFLQATYGPTNLATSCDASGPADAQVLVTSTNTCATPSCNIDFCGLKAAGYQRCILNEQGIMNCPPGGYQRRIVNKGFGGACGACGCGVTAPTKCTPTLNAYTGAGCTNLSESYPLDGSCAPNLLSNSMQLNVVRTDGTCNAGANGSANVAGPVTLCCVP